MPCGKIFAVEQNHGIRRRGQRLASGISKGMCGNSWWRDLCGFDGFARVEISKLPSFIIKQIFGRDIPLGTTSHTFIDS
jgi:hypothetical protein